MTTNRDILEDFLRYLYPDESIRVPAEPSAIHCLAEVLEQAFNTLLYRECEILKMYYGLGDGYRYSLEEIAHVFKKNRYSRDKILNIKAEAIIRLQHPVLHQMIMSALE